MQDNYVTIMQWVKVIGKPCKRKLYARFDEGSLRRLLQIRDLLYIIILFSSRSHAISWLPNEGEYKFTSNFLFVDEETEDAQDKRNEELLEITGEINYLLEQNKLPSYKKKRLGALEDFYNNYDIFNDDSF